LALAALPAGDVARARELSDATWRHLGAAPQTAAYWRAYIAQAALADGDLISARRWADDAVQTTTGWHRVNALTARAYDLRDARRVGSAFMVDHLAFANETRHWFECR
jgi:hypothetical protein